MITYYQIAALLTFISTGLLAFFVLVKGAGRPVTRLFGIYTLAISAWSFCWFKMIATGTYSESLFWCRFLHYPASFIPATFLHFVQHLLNIHRERKQVIVRRLVYGFGVLFLSVSFAPGFIKTAVPKQCFPYFLEPGPYYVTFLIFFVVTISSIHFLLFIGYKTAQGFKKTQIGYVFVAYVLAYLGGTEVFLPVYGLHLPLFALYLIPLSHAIVAYTILAHGLMDITIIIRKTLIYSVLTALLTAVYMGVAFALAAVFQGRLFGSPTPLTYAVAAIAITLLFHPLRMRIQRWVDRHFFRELLDNDFLQELTSGFVHELRRPLATISAPLELTLMDLRDIQAGHRRVEELLPKMQERLQYSLKASIEASRRIEAVQELNAPQNTPPEKVHISEILTKSLAMEQFAMQQHHVELDVDVSPSLPNVLGHANQLELVFMNLIKNALEAMEHQTHARRLILRGSQLDHSVRISVTDSGPGMTPEQRARLFEPYFSTKGAKGMGMGLYLSQQVLKAHGGSIEARKSETGGMEFTLVLPVPHNGDRP